MNANQMFDDFLFNRNRRDRKGIMTNARFGQFNERYNTNLAYYNEKIEMNVLDECIFPRIYGVITITWNLIQILVIIVL